MFNSTSYFSPFPFQNVPTLFLEGKGDGSQLLFDFTYFKVCISILSPRFWHLIAFGCFHFPDGWGGWGTGWKGRCTCRPGFKAEGGTPQHPHKVSRIWMNFLKQTQTLIAGSTSVLRAFNCMEFPLCSWWMILRGAGWLVENKRAWKCIKHGKEHTDSATVRKHRICLQHSFIRTKKSANEQKSCSCMSRHFWEYPVPRHLRTGYSQKL